MKIKANIDLIDKIMARIAGLFFILIAYFIGHEMVYSKFTDPDPGMGVVFIFFCLGMAYFCWSGKFDENETMKKGTGNETEI